MPVPGRHPSPTFSCYSSTSEQSRSIQQHPNGKLPIAAGNPVRSAAGSSKEQEPGVSAMVTPWLTDRGHEAHARSLDIESTIGDQRHCHDGLEGEYCIKTSNGSYTYELRTTNQELHLRIVAAPGHAPSCAPLPRGLWLAYPLRCRVTESSTNKQHSLFFSPPSFTQTPFPPRSLMRDRQTSPHRRFSD